MTQEDQIKKLIAEKYARCVKDPIFFMKEYAYIQHPTQGKIKFNLYNFQEKVVHLLTKNPKTIILKSRQLGISTLLAGMALHMMVFNKDKNVLVLATKQETAKNLITKTKVMWESLPVWVRGNKKPEENNKLTLKLANGSQIKAVPATSDSGRSEAVSLLIIDEAAFIENIEATYASVQQTVATGGSVCILSTPNGVGNWFHKMWVKAQNGENEYLPIKLKWDVHPERDQSWRLKQDDDLGERLAAQECDTSFLTSGNTLIDPIFLTGIEELGMIEEPLERRGIGGDYWIWKYPNYSHNYIVSSDISRGDGNDYSTFHVIDIDESEQVAEFKGKVAPKDMGHLLAEVATGYNNALLVVENANIGWSTIETLLEIGYNNIYFSPKSYSDLNNNDYISKIETNQSVPGFSMTSKIRPLVISKIETYFREKSIIIHSRRLLEELRVFIWHKGKCQAAEGYNDDLVMALGIGLYVRDHAARFFMENQQLSKSIFEAYSKTSTTGNFFPISTGFNSFNNPYKMKHGNEDIDISWVLR